MTKKAPKRLELLVADLMHELACEIDLHYEDDDMATLADEDSTFLTYRRALRELRKRDLPVSSAVLHVERRIKDAYKEAFGKPLPPVSNKRGTDKIV